MATPKILLYEVELRAVRLKRNLSRPVVYTNDLNSAEFQFKVIDMDAGDLSTATATTLLYMRDGSFFQNPKEDVSLVGTTFSYTLKENEGNHAGIAKIQLIVTIGEAEYATQLYEFEIINGLETKVAQEVMIYDWTTLTRDARAYIDQFVADEVFRDAQFDNAQFDRNVAFVSSQESRDLAFGVEQTDRGAAFTTEQTNRNTAFTNDQDARALTFSESESGRTTAETERVTAESNRVTAESGRVTKESQRVTAETNRVTAEGNRATAESGRVTAENGRVTAETNRAAAFTAFNTRLTAEETATANNKISTVKGKTFTDVDARLEDVEFETATMAENKVINGDFSSGTSGWSGVYATLSAASNVLSVTADGSNPIPRFFQVTSGKLTQGSKIFAAQRVRVTNNVCSRITIEMKHEYQSSALGYFNIINSPIQDNWYLSSGVSTVPQGYDANNIILYTYATYADNATASGKVTQASRPIVINLTDVFGKGNEPTAEQMDAILAKFPNSWFDGTKNLFRANATLNKLMAVDARTEFEARNGVTNGDFSNGTTGWNASNCTPTVSNGILSFTGTAAGANGVTQEIPNYPQYISHKVYFAGTFKASKLGVNLILNDGVDQTLIQHEGDNIFRIKSGIRQIAPGAIALRARIYDMASSGWAEVQIKNMFVIDLTAAFGAGKEPTLAEMDRLMARFPNSWFDGVKPVQTIETLYQEKANKVQEVWITPTLSNGWIAETGRTIKYFKDEFGNVKISGRIKGGTVGAIIFTLPTGYRPSEPYGVPVICSGGTLGFLEVTTAGNVVLVIGTNTYCEIQTVNFRV